MSQFFNHSLGLLILVCLGMGELPAYAQTANPPVESAKSADPFFLTRAKNLARQAAEQQNGGLNAYRAEGAMYGPAVDAPHVQNPDGSVTFTFKGGAPGFVTPTVETIAQVTLEGEVQLQYNGPLRSAPAANVQPTQPQPPIPIQTPPNRSTPLEKPVAIPIAPTPSTATQSLESRPPLPSSTDGPPSNPSDLPTLQSTAAASPDTSQKRSSIATSVEPIRPSAAPKTLSASIRNPDALADLFLSRARNLARQAAIKENRGLAQYRPEPSMFGPTAGTPHTKNQDGSITFRFRGGVPGYQTPTVESVVTVTANNEVTVTYNGPVRQ